MEKDIPVSNHPANSQSHTIGLTSNVPPTCNIYADGQSVENALSPSSSLDMNDDERHWYVVRATQGRAQKVYDEIVNLNSQSFEVYLPRYRYETLQITDGYPKKMLTEGPLHSGLLFVRSTRNDYDKLVHFQEPYPTIKGLTPYYDHFRKLENGRNDYLVVPDKQFYDFRIILESEDVNILVEQESMPSYLNGKRVQVVSGSFSGVTGTMLRWKGLRRVFIKLDQVGTFATGFIRTCDFRIIE